MKRLLALIPFLIASPAWATCELKADTAATITAGMFVDSTDGVTTEEALTLVVAEVFLSKAGGALAAKNDAGNPAHLNAGVYDIDLDATDTNTEGTLDIYIEDNVTTALRVWRHCMVLGADFYDLKYGTTTVLTAEDTGLLGSGTLDGVTDTDTVSLDSGPSNNDAWNGATLFIEEGTQDCISAIDDYTGTGNGVELDPDKACSFTPTTAATWKVYATASGAALATAQADLDTMAGSDGALVASTGQPTNFISDISEMHDGEVLATGTCDSGDANSCVDAVLTEVDDYWKGNMIVFQSGTNDNVGRCIYDFVAASDSVDFRPDAPASVTTEQYKIVSAPGCVGVVAP